MTSYAVQDLLLYGFVAVILAAVIIDGRRRLRRKREQRGFEVITKPDSKTGQEARKE